MLLRLGADDPDLGGKARGLARAMAAGLDVPPGFVVPARIFRAALAAAGGLPDDPDARLLAERAEALRRAPLELPAIGPGPWVVRSSATVEDGREHAAPGIFLSRRDVDTDDVVDAVRAVWASLLSPTAAAYLGLRRIAWRDAAMAVVIQAQVEGTLLTAYSRAPGAPEHVLLETVDGTARALVGETLAGAIPDLTEADLRACAAVARTAEGFLGGPADVELVRGDRLWVVQARPVPRRPPRAATVPDEELARALAFSRAEPDAVWTWDATHNPAPLTPAQAGLVALVEAAGVAGVRQKVVLGYLYATTQGAPPPLRIIPTADLARIYTDELSPLFTQALARMGRDLEATLDAYLELYRLYARVLAPSLRGAGPVPIELPDLAPAELAAAWDVGAPTYGEHGVPSGPFRAPKTLRDLDDFLFARAQAGVRRALATLGAGWGESANDLAFLPLEDLRAAGRRGVAPENVRGRAAEARAELARLADFAPPLQIVNGHAIFGAPSGALGVLRGRGSGGRARGRVQRLDPGNPRRAEGTIVVCAAALPTLAPLLADARALVVEHDGLLGHGAALARELGIPCVVGCVGALTALLDGDEIWVDADAGVVLRLG